MRSSALLVTLLLAGAAWAQEPIAPAPVEPPPPPAVPPPPVAPPPAARRPVLLAPLVPPPGYRYQLIEGAPPPTRRWGMFTGGIVTFTALWAASLQAGILTGQNLLDVPLLGPLLEISAFTNPDHYRSSSDGWFIFLLVSNSVAQIGGFSLMVASAATQTMRKGPQTIELVPLGTGAAVRATF
jgi:hypothetical protein